MWCVGCQGLDKQSTQGFRKALRSCLVAGSNPSGGGFYPLCWRLLEPLRSLHRPQLRLHRRMRLLKPVARKGMRAADARHALRLPARKYVSQSSAYQTCT